MGTRFHGRAARITFNSFDLARLAAGVRPFRVHFFSTLRSTNDHAAVLRKRGELFAPAMVLAGRQTAGRGRGANSWFSDVGSLTVTFVLPVNGMLSPHHLPLAAGLAARNALAEMVGNEDVQLKWPNDVVCRSSQKDMPTLARAQTGETGSQARVRAWRPGKDIGLRKLAGLLCERIDNVDLIGIGVNVNAPARRLPKHLADRMVYLEQIQLCGGGAIDLTGALIALARHLHTGLVRRSETPFPLLLREYDRHHALVGRTVTVISPNEAPVTGKCQGLDDMGRLLL